MSTGPEWSLENITCAGFAALPEAEQRIFILGVANGRGLTAGMFEAYAGAAQDMCSSQTDREAIAIAYQKIRGLMEPLLAIDADSLLNGVRAACARRDLEDSFVINALAVLHIEAARRVREHYERQKGQEDA